MSAWQSFPPSQALAWNPERVRANWADLHRGDALPCPQEPALLHAWALFHNGAFEAATQAGLALGDPGVVVAHKATSIYATYLEPREKRKLELFLQVAERAREQAQRHSQDASAHYWQAYALGRYSQGISVAKALAQGLGARVKTALEATIALQARHADAHIVLASFHAEVIDKVGPLVGAMTYGASKEQGLQLFDKALLLNPGSAIAHIEKARGLLMLEGPSHMAQAQALYEQAAQCSALDAEQMLDVAMAQAELAAD
jgi:hypothetical protein